MPFKDRAKRLQYINKYNGPYYAKNRLTILAQKQVYHRQHKEVVQAKMAARRKGKEEQAAANTRAWYANARALYKLLWSQVMEELL